MAIYRIGGSTFDTDGPAGSALLAAAHASKGRPLCPCQGAGVEMYIAKSGERYLVKRMPNTGGDHSPECDSFEPPAELSGAGEVQGSAIQESPGEDVTRLKLGFSLLRTGAKRAPEASGTEPTSVSTRGSRLTLRGLLHYLWDEAKLNRWAPGMAGRRSWGVVRRELLRAAENKEANGGALAQCLFIPETFVLERADEIRGRRDGRLASVKRPPKGPRPLMLAIAEVKAVAPARYGHKMTFRHLSDFPFFLDDELHSALLNRFAVALDLSSAVEDSHLVAIGTFGLSESGLAHLEEVSLMVTASNWLPFETVHEKQLLDVMTAQGRRFIKGLRYNLPSSKPLASVVATDTAAGATAMYIVQPGASDEYRDSLDALIAESRFTAWRCDVAGEGMPAVPPAPARALPPPQRALPDLRGAG